MRTPQDPRADEDLLAMGDRPSFAREDAARRGRPTRRILPLIVVVYAFFVGGVVLFYAQYSGTLRWVAYVVLLSFVGFALAAYLMRDLPGMRSLRSGVSKPPSRRGEFSRLTNAIRRASQGSRYSQVLVMLRLREVCLERLAVIYDLEAETVEALLGETDASVGVIKDPFLASFLGEAKRLKKIWPHGLQSVHPRPDFVDYVDTALRHMERLS
jgi:hypothetical protein